MTSTETRSRSRAGLLAPPLLVGVLIAGAVLVGILAAQGSLLVLAVAFLVVAWILLVRHYEMALAILLVGFYLYPTGLGLIGVSTSSNRTLGFYALIASAALVGGYIRHPNALSLILQRRGTLIMSALVAWTITSFLLFSFENQLALKRLGFMVFLMIIPLIAGQFVTAKDLRRFYWFCVGVSLAGIVLLVKNLSLASPDDLTRVSANENASPLGFAYSVGMCAVMSLGLLMSGSVSKAKQSLLWLQLAGTAVVLIASGSRGPILALGVGIIVLLFRSSQRARVKILVAVALGVLMAWLSLPLVPTVVYNRLVSVIWASSSGQLGAEFENSRGIIWQLSLRAWQSRPLFGVGLANFGLSGPDAGTNFSHNVIIESMVELGLVGLLILVAFLGNLGKSALRMVRQAGINGFELSLVALSAFSVVSMSFSGMLQASVDFWMVSAFVISLSAQQKYPTDAHGDADLRGRARLRARLVDGSPAQ